MREPFRSYISVFFMSIVSILSFFSSFSRSNCSGVSSTAKISSRSSELNPAVERNVSSNVARRSQFHSPSILVEADIELLFFFNVWNVDVDDRHFLDAEFLDDGEAEVTAQILYLCALVRS